MQERLTAADNPAADGFAICIVLHLNQLKLIIGTFLSLSLCASVSLLANLPEDKLSKIVDCLEVVSYSARLSPFPLGGDKLEPFSKASAGSSREPELCR